MDFLPVSEIFGPVWQGEGPATGQRCTFVRLGHCNLSCEWCDTPYTWDETRFDLVFEQLTADEVLTRMPGDALLAILSGGEPLMHQTRQAFLELLSSGHVWHVETNGTILPRPETVERVSLFNVSPKINTNDRLSKRIKPKVLERFAELAAMHQAVFKFVCASAHDVQTVAELSDSFDLRRGAVWIMPEGTTPGAILNGARQLADAVSDQGFNLTLRQQVLMYGTERGK